MSGETRFDNGSFLRTQPGIIEYQSRADQFLPFGDSETWQFRDYFGEFHGGKVAG